MTAIPLPDRILPRATWTSSPHGADLDWPKAGRALYVHITESPGRDLTTRARECAALRAIRSYHVNGRGWMDLGYSYALAQPWARKGAASIYVGRGARRIPASQQGANRGNWSVAVIAAQHEFIMDRTVRAIAWLARELGAVRVLPHSAQNATDCPGDALRAAIPEIRRLAGL